MILQFLIRLVLDRNRHTLTLPCSQLVHFLYSDCSNSEVLSIEPPVRIKDSLVSYLEFPAFLCLHINLLPVTMSKSHPCITAFIHLTHPLSCLHRHLRI